MQDGACMDRLDLFNFSAPCIPKLNDFCCLFELIYMFSLTLKLNIKKRVQVKFITLYSKPLLRTTILPLIHRVPASSISPDYEQFCQVQRRNVGRERICSMQKFPLACKNNQFTVHAQPMCCRFNLDHPDLLTDINTVHTSTTCDLCCVLQPALCLVKWPST